MVDSVSSIVSPVFQFLTFPILALEQAPTLKELGIEMEVRIQGGRGGYHSNQGHNMNWLLGLGTDVDGANKVQVTTETIAYSSVNDDHTRQHLSFVPEELIRCAEQGRVEGYINRHQGVLMSNELVLDFSGCTMIEIIIVIGMFLSFLFTILIILPTLTFSFRIWLRLGSLYHFSSLVFVSKCGWWRYRSTSC